MKFLLSIKKTHQPYIVALLLVVMAFVFHYKTINEFPQYRHCWAQCDRYAIALGFIDNGGDLLHPQTFVYNKQFPDDFEKVRDNTITSVDFPIHDYIVSWLMRLFNSTNPWVFRLYTLCYSLVGFYYLYKLSALFTHSFAKQISVLLFALSSSTILYYQAGFLPTIPSLANGFIGLYFYFSYSKKQNNNHFYYAIAFITLATLARLPFAILLVGICCVEFLLLIKNKQIPYKKIIVLLLAFMLIAMYYSYNNYLRDTYGSLFLNYIIPAESFEVLIDYIIAVYERWLFQYFSVIHYALLAVLFVAYVINFIRKKTVALFLNSQLLWLTTILLIGCCMYYVLMAFQFLNHDYYFLDTFYIPIVLLFLFLIINIPEIKNSLVNTISKVLLLLLFIPLFIYASQVNKTEREQDFYKQKTTAQNFENAASLLNSLGIAKEAKILTIGTDGVNNAYILMQRKGYTVVTTWQPHKIELALSWPYDYVVLENNRLMNVVYNNYPTIISKLTKIGGNDNLSVYIKKKDNVPVSINDFFGLNYKTKLYHQSIHFDSIPTHFSNTNSVSDFTNKKNTIGKADSLTEYAITHHIKNISILNTSEQILKISANYFFKENLKSCLLCVSIKTNGKDVVFLTKDLSKENLKINEWITHETVFSLPQVTEPNTEIGIFIWNTGKNNLYYDDIDYSIY